jgi:DUF971 family protein
LPIPRSVSLDGPRVRIEWSDGHASVFSNKRLREACPCALCRGEPAPLGGAVIPLTVAVPAGVSATRYSMVGRYAVSFAWSDGHSSGIYPYEYLLELCECEACARGRRG